MGASGIANVRNKSGHDGSEFASTISEDDLNPPPSGTSSARWTVACRSIVEATPENPPFDLLRLAQLGDLLGIVGGGHRSLLSVLGSPQLVAIHLRIGRHVALARGKRPIAHLGTMMRRPLDVILAAGMQLEPAVDAAPMQEAIAVHCHDRLFVALAAFNFDRDNIHGHAAPSSTRLSKQKT